MKVENMQRSLGKSQCSTTVRTVPVAGAVYPFNGPKQPITYGPKVVQSIAAFTAAVAASKPRPGSF